MSATSGYPDEMWFGLAACGCATSWSVVHPSDAVQAEQIEALMPPGNPCRPTRWLLLPREVGGQFMGDLQHPIIRRDGGADGIDWSPEKCAGGHGPLPEALDTWTPT